MRTSDQHITVGHIQLSLELGLSNYFFTGTWTKSSSNILPRRPLGRDESLDYDYDSGEDWEEEGDGEVIVSDGSDEEDSGSDEEEEGWLVEDEEVEEVVDEAAGEPSESPAKRKAKATTHDKDTKRRKVEKLVSFQKGPCWEVEIGQCTYDAFNMYRIQLLNGEPMILRPFHLVWLTTLLDCPYPVDPFTFIPEPFDQAATTKSTESATAPVAGASFAIPIPSTTNSDPNAPATLGTSNRVVSIAKKQVDAANLKNPFPDAHLAELYGLIEGSEKTLKGLVEDLYLALKKYPGVKKYAIEAKLREVADKSRSVDASTKRWRVSDEAWVRISKVMTIVRAPYPLYIGRCGRHSPK